MATQAGRNPGRPAGNAPDAQDALITEAARLFAGQGYEATSLRQVADGAGVTPAMVAYYFRTKEGLLEAVVLDGLDKLLAVVEGSVREHEPGNFVATLIRNYLSRVGEFPWIPQIIIREVVSRDTPLRNLFMKQFAERAVALVPPVVAEEMAMGQLRADLDPRYTLLSLVGMCLFPFIAWPVLGKLLDYELDEAFRSSYAEHAISLFLRGAGNPEGAANG